MYRANLFVFGSNKKHVWVFVVRVFSFKHVVDIVPKEVLPIGVLHF